MILWYAFWCHTKDLMSLHIRSMVILLKFGFQVEFVWFLGLCVASLLCESSWAIRLSAASVVAPYWVPTLRLMQVHFEDGYCPSPGVLSAALYLEFLRLSVALITLLCKNKYLAFEPRTGTKSHIYSTHRVSSLHWDAKIEKFDTKQNFKKQMSGSVTV
jgi:hypothetical protein